MDKTQTLGVSRLLPHINTVEKSSLNIWSRHLDRRLIIDQSRSTINKRERERRNFHRIITRRRGERKTSPSPPRSLSRDGISVTRKGKRRTSPSSSPYLSRSRAQAGGVLRHPHLPAFSSPPLPRFHSLSFSPPSINDRSRRNSPSTRGFSSPGSQFGNITKKLSLRLHCLCFH